MIDNSVMTHPHVEIEQQTQLKIADIRTDGATQSRAELDQSKITEYAQLMLEGAVFPSATIFYDGTYYWLADGFHRYHASKQIDRDVINVDVRQGTRRDAVLYAMEANTRHGIPLPLADRKRCARTLLEDEEWSKWSDREIARRCGIDGKTVAAMRPKKIAEYPQCHVGQPVEPVEEVLECVTLRTPSEVVAQWFIDYPTLHHLSNREIAKRCGVTEGTVRNYKKELQPEPVLTPEREPSSKLTVIWDEPEQSQIIEGVSEEVTEQEQEADVSLPEIVGPVIAPETEEPNQVEEVPILAVEPETITTTQELIEMVLEPEQPIEDTPTTVTPQETFQPIAPDVLFSSKEDKRETPDNIQREAKREEVRERNAYLRANGVELPQGQYACLVVDPPWQMQKIEREERPNQFEFDYPTMTEEELKNFQLPEMAADDCHLYLWTTQKHLPLALRLAEHWGFKYQCLMTWVKNVGFTPFSWMYSTEHVLFCTKGSLPLLAIGKRLDFGGKVREHSRKPDEFYEIIREVSPGPRIDIFSREKRDGFDQYGNEVEKYVSA
jgi:N6-adenosine-specific RNA methylase IME4